MRGGFGHAEEPDDREDGKPDTPGARSQAPGDERDSVIGFPPDGVAAIAR